MQTKSWRTPPPPSHQEALYITQRLTNRGGGGISLRKIDFLSLTLIENVSSSFTLVVSVFDTLNIGFLKLARYREI